MSVSYDKLRNILRIYKIKHYTLRKETGLTTSEIAKINKDMYLTLQSAEQIARYLSTVTGKRVRIDDLMEFKEP